ncbi:hypothetical protein HW03_00755 [Pseudomonas aeruginosa]|nr:hypothetical protein AI22_19325 [Pseudomonas aeruginosa YL84]ALY75298.1 hypothetical protein HW03_00755 [Pseudomonas aeruginosa]OFM80950.1 hypothetical protein HMPREF2670_09000 [Pseudomonas sp. HMSC072F09]OHP05070.1 hypothetical protein HMPREF2581_12770 [Pseudomonas sp. HMSC057H01]KRU73060.1 hypothetical protein AN452_06825 [Pseudomonas aeruginosa]
MFHSRKLKQDEPPVIKKFRNIHSENFRAREHPNFLYFLFYSHLQMDHDFILQSTQTRGYSGVKSHPIPCSDKIYKTFVVVLLYLFTVRVQKL